MGGSPARPLISFLLWLCVIISHTCIFTEGDEEVLEPRFVGQMSSTSAGLGREASLSCTVANKATYKVVWMRVEDGTILSLDGRLVTQSGRISVTTDSEERTWTLTIRNLTHSDRGCYMCQINTPIMMKQIGCIDLHVGPEIVDEETSGDVTVSEGDNANLVCKARGHPTPSIVWRREDSSHILHRPDRHRLYNVARQYGEVLHLRRIDRSEMGAYLCIASNDQPPAVSKRINLYVQFSPSVRVGNEVVKCSVGDNVTLTCEMEAFPLHLYYWTKNSNKIVSDGVKYLLEEERLSAYRVVLRLTVLTFDIADSAVYYCVALNRLGRAQYSVMLITGAVENKGDDYESTTAVIERQVNLFNHRVEGSKPSTSTFPSSTLTDEMDQVTRCASILDSPTETSFSFSRPNSPNTLLLLYLITYCVNYNLYFLQF